jgi:hypothetical protein
LSRVSIASAPKSRRSSGAASEYASSMKSTPSSARRTARSVLIAVSPTYWPTRPARSTSTRWPRRRRPIERYISASRPRDRRLAGARVAQEDEVLRGRDLREPVLGAPPLYLEERDEGSHLLLHGFEADEGVELGLQLLHAPRRRWLAQQVELVGDPVGAAVAAADPKALSQHAQAVLEIVEWFPRHARSKVPAARGADALRARPAERENPGAYGLSAGALVTAQTGQSA